MAMAHLSFFDEEEEIEAALTFGDANFDENELLYEL